jgi:hypothetical protein
MALVPGVIACSYVQSIFIDGLLRLKYPQLEIESRRGPEGRSARRILELLE